MSDGDRKETMTGARGDAPSDGQAVDVGSDADIATVAPYVDDKQTGGAGEGATEATGDLAGHPVGSSGDAPQKPAFDRRMLEFLVCPETRGVLSYDAEAQELVSKAAHLAYPIRNGIPVMLRDEARKLD